MRQKAPRPEERPGHKKGEQRNIEEVLEELTFALARIRTLEQTINELKEEIVKLRNTT